MTPRLELRNIVKRYAGSVANDDVSLSVMPGEIHAILGENGAGKSTLMKIIYGAATADAGEIYWEGRRILAPNPASSRALGIEMVYQHFALFESISVLENIALSSSGRFRPNALASQIKTLSLKYGMAVDPRRYVHDLSIGERQQVEIVRCLLRKPRLLIMDEPTSVLAPQAVSNLFSLLRQLANDGCSILYISHKLEEIGKLCDSATVLRNGKITGRANPRNTTPRELARMMVGSDLPETRVSESAPGTHPVLQVKNLNTAPADGVQLRNISFEVYPGEVVGIGGISGNGQGELTSLLSGEELHANADSIVIDGLPSGLLGAGRRRRQGLAFIPEDRLGRAAVPSHPLWKNALLTGHRRNLVGGGLVDRQKCEAFANAITRKFRVKAEDTRSPAQSLSGGNLQKFIVGRELLLQPKLLLACQPTWGVDVGASAFIRQTLVELSRSGAAVLVISEDLDELFEISDRILILCQGSLSASLRRTQTSREEVGLLMTAAAGA
jgi:general nucleoside transport system ATP-binding protein